MTSAGTVIRDGSAITSGSHKPNPAVVLAELAGSAGHGGGERYLQLLLQGMDRTEFQPLLICPEDGPFAAAMEHAGVPTRVVLLEPLVNPVAILRLTRLLRRERVAVLQTHGARSNFYGLVAGRLACVPIIIATIHNSILDYEVGPVKRRLYLAMQRHTVRLADRIICVSDALRQYMIEHGGASSNRTVTVHNGIDLSKFDRAVTGASIRDLYQIWGGPVLVVIGRLTPQKGHIYLLQALPSLLDEWPQLRCLIVGEGEMRGPLDALSQSLGLGRHCVFAGVSDTIPEMLAAADLFVLPSLSEGFPFVVLEALAMGRPVVATAIDGVTEVIQDGVTGRLVPPRDPTALASAIREMLRDPAGAGSMGMRGRRLVEERFTADRMMTQVMAMIEGLCGRQDATLPAQAKARP